MQYLTPENAAERRRELRRRAEDARLARQARRSRRREEMAAGGRLSGGEPGRGGLSGGGLSGGEPGRGGLGRGWLRLSRRVVRALADGARAQRRAAVLNASPDRYLPHPCQPPATYQEFLARTAGPLLREPSAAGRSRGRRAG